MISFNFCMIFVLMMKSKENFEDILIQDILRHFDGFELQKVMKGRTKDYYGKIGENMTWELKLLEICLKVMEVVLEY